MARVPWVGALGAGVAEGGRAGGRECGTRDAGRGTRDAVRRRRGGRVGVGSTRAVVTQIIFVDDPREAKVADLDIARPAEQHVGGLEIAVQHVGRVQIAQRLEDL